MAKPSDFIQDHHTVSIRWDEDTLKIGSVWCPWESDDSTGMCNRLRDYCVVERFFDVYGAELNIGTTSVDGPVEIAWIGVPGGSDIDSEYSQVWIIPVEDPDFRAALFTERNEVDQAMDQDEIDALEALLEEEPPEET